MSQVGTDRIVELQFSDGQYRLFLEFYAGGNIVLTDKELNVLALWRIITEGTEDEQLRVGVKYSLEHRQNYAGVPALTKKRVKDALKSSAITVEDGQATVKSSKRRAGNVLRKTLAVTMTEFPPTLVDHAFRVTKFDTSLTPEQVLQSDDLLERLLEALKEARRVIEDITSAETCTGYIIAKPSRGGRSKSETEDPLLASSGGDKQRNMIYDDFHPFKPQQFEDDPDMTVLPVEGFNRTVDEFFSSIEGQKLESKLQDREENAKRKLEAARKDHEKRLGGLQTVQELNIQKAQAIEANVQRVEEAAAAINGLIAQGMDWVEIARLIEMEQGRHNPVAATIKLPLKLYENTATLWLGEAEAADEDYEGDETDSDVSESGGEDDARSKSQKAKQAVKMLAVDVDLALSPWANARQYYDQRRTAVIKEQRTLQSSSKALKNTERKITADLLKGLKLEKAVLRPARTPFWFEKFMYFISSDSYLVLGGKDMQQNEILYKRYLKRGDVYVHGDVQGASMLIIKNKLSTPDAPIPPSTLSQAGMFSISTSSAWDSKAIMSAWWVTFDQVSKTAPNGDFLGIGGFHISGRKNFLPPAQLILGFGVLFQVSEASLATHTKHRVRDDAEESNLAAAESSVNATADGVDNVQLSEQDGEDEDGEVPDHTESESGSDMDDQSGGRERPDERSNPLQPRSHVSSTQARHENPERASPENEADPDLEAPEDSKAAMPKEASISERPPYDETSKQSAIRHISARERRLLRKVPTFNLPTQATSDDGVSDDDHDASLPTSETTIRRAPSLISISTPPSTITTSSTAPIPRGKRAKAKKVAAKYANQDPEDRALAMELLGSDAAQKKASNAATVAAARESELNFQKARRREQHERAALAGKAHEATRKQDPTTAVDIDENADDDDDANASLADERQLALLDQFVGKCLPTDEILEAIPVCAPWNSLATFKYKAKLQPGTGKKGKVVKEILGRWVGGDDARDKALAKRVDEMGQDEGRMWPRERELIRGWRVEEVVGVVAVKGARVVWGGGEGGGGWGGKTGGSKAGTSTGKGKRGGRGSKKK